MIGIVTALVQIQVAPETETIVKSDVRLRTKSSKPVILVGNKTITYFTIYAGVAKWSTALHL